MFKKWNVNLLMVGWIFWIMWFSPVEIQLSKPIDILYMFMFDLRMINMSSECKYDLYWKISACSGEYEVCYSFASLTRQQTSYSCS
jgi:hypothetical protein